jgi:hypothetical protein
VSDTNQLDGRTVLPLNFRGAAEPVRLAEEILKKLPAALFSSDDGQLFYLFEGELIPMTNALLTRIVDCFFVSARLAQDRATGKWTVVSAPFVIGDRKVFADVIAAIAFRALTGAPGKVQALSAQKQSEIRQRAREGQNAVDLAKAYSVPVDKIWQIARAS